MIKPYRIAINGLGRIGRLTLRKVWDNPDLELVAANSRSSAETYARLIKYDSSYGIWDKKIEAKGDDLIIDGKILKMVHEDDPLNLPWQKLEVDLVIESTGIFCTREEAEAHLKAGAKRVLISAPAKDKDVITLIMGINENIFDPEKDFVVSSASCTTTCLAPVVKVIEEKFGLKHGFMTTIHAYTNDQKLQDSPHEKDPRRARAAATSIIPTTTGAAKTVGKIIPEVEGKLNGISMRVPLLVPSVVDFVAELKKSVTKEEVNEAFVKASQEEKLKDLFAVSDEPLVSIDYKQNSHGSIVDLLSTEVVDGKMINVVSWYDNEWGYMSQMVRLVEYIAKQV